MWTVPRISWLAYIYVKKIVKNFKKNPKKFVNSAKKMEEDSPTKSTSHVSSAPPTAKSPLKRALSLDSTSGYHLFISNIF
jgi:hypothetical protein